MLRCSLVRTPVFYFTYFCQCGHAASHPIAYKRLHVINWHFWFLKVRSWHCFDRCLRVCGLADVVRLPMRRQYLAVKSYRRCSRVFSRRISEQSYEVICSSNILPIIEDSVNSAFSFINFVIVDVISAYERFFQMSHLCLDLLQDLVCFDLSLTSGSLDLRGPC